ncbi:MAG: ATP-binding protein [Bacilli bacterium]|nr:ATP-binding protein [Bacilli bacterium]
MYLKDIIPERMFEDTDFDYKATLQDGNPMKWAKSIVAFANGDGGTIYVGVSDGL